MVFLRLCSSAWRGGGQRMGYAFPWLAGATWALMDWVQTWLLSGFPWDILGTTQYRTPLVAAFAALAGVHGLSFVIVACNSGMVLILCQRRQQWLAGSSAVAAVVVLVCGWGAYHLRALSCETLSPPLRIGIVQGNIRQDVKWDPGWKGATTDKYIALTRQLIQKAGPVDLIIWPETALPFRFDDAEHTAYRRAVTQLAMDLDTPLLVGSLGTVSPNGATGLYNRAFLIDRDGHLAASGDKVHLVPFGEYLPLPWLFDYMRGLTAQSGAFDAGQEHAVISLPGRDSGSGSIPMGLFVCYESNFPSITRELARKGAGLLVNTTNDAWFGTTAAPYQHFAMVVMRAVETGRSVVRAANTGISGAIGPDGRVLEATKLFTTDDVVVDIHPRQAQTPYVRYGDVIIGVSAMVWVWFLLSLVRCRRRVVLQQIGAAADELRLLAMDPVPLQRPLVLVPGYDSSAAAMHVLNEHLARCFTHLSGAIVELDLRHDLPLQDLVSQAQAQLPAESCDFIGHSLGGLVATAMARPCDVTPWVFALAAPLRGTCIARAGLVLGYPYRRILRDLVGENAQLARIREQASEQAGFRGLRLAGDPVSSGLPARLQRTLLMPVLLGPRRRHQAIHADPRAIVEIVLALRGRPLAQEKRG